MTLSVWRYSHLALAVSSFIFVLLASLTGLVLALEPAVHRMQPYATQDLNVVLLAQTVSAAQKQYAEVLEIKVEKNTFVVADVITQDGDAKQYYIDPKTARPLAEVGPENAFFQWVTTLHRSLFLHGLGRVFMGITAFLLLLIAVTGSILVLKRQRGFSKFFSKVVREDFFQFYHVVFGRIWLAPIVIIAATGTFLSLHEFDVFKDSKADVKAPDVFKTTPKIAVAAFPAFRETTLADVISVEFPFSTDAEDVFTLKRQDAQWTVNQFTGEILTRQPETSLAFWARTSLDLHTGRASVIWALVLGIAALNILFFIWSGFAMTLKRRSGRIQNKFKPNDAEFVVLVGSENGSTLRFAKAFHLALLQAGKRSHITELNRYQSFASAQHIIAFTATYGLAEPPANASKAMALLEKHAQKTGVTFAVLGFGSHAYPDFCAFAYALYNSFSKQASLRPLMEMTTVNDKSTTEFSQWLRTFSEKTGLALQPDLKLVLPKPARKVSFTVTYKSASEIDQAFLIRLKPMGKVSFTSGDLLSVYPLDNHVERQYSIGRIGNQIQLSVKRHDGGLGSQYLYGLETGQQLSASVQKHRDFHAPKRGTLVLIANGTGIAPFLGMIDENTKAGIHLYAGFRNNTSFAAYAPLLEAHKASGKLNALHVAYSREGNRHYVVDALRDDRDFLATTLQNGGTLMLCGSLAMQQNVFALLEEICSAMGQTLAHYQGLGQIKSDCY